MVKNFDRGLADFNIILIVQNGRIVVQKAGEGSGWVPKTMEWHRKNIGFACSKGCFDHDKRGF